MGDVVNLDQVRAVADRQDATIAEKARAGKLTKAERRHAILTLRKAGMTEQQIADALGTTKSSVSRTLNMVLREYADAESALAEQVRQVQLARLDDMLASIWKAVRAGNLKAIDRALRIEKLRGDLVGTAAPTRHEHDHKGTVEHKLTANEVEAEQRAWLNAGGEPVEGTAELVDEQPADGR
jgi:predicted transcriptional regulator